MINFKKYILSVLMVSSFIVILSISPETSLAQETETGTLPDYVLLENSIPGIANDDGKTTTLSRYLPGAFNFILGFAAVLAFVMISWSGFQYMTTDAVFGKSQARENLKGAVYGLLLVLASYAILYTINPKILEFNLNLKRINIQKQPTVTGATPTGSSCTQCQTLTSLNLPSTSGAGSNPQISASTGTKLQYLNTALQNAGIEWAITEAWPPTRNHQDPCHAAGTCVDARPNVKSAENVIKFQEFASAAGLRAVYEVKTTGEANALREAGYTGQILVLPDKLVNGELVEQITGPHFSVYNN